MLGDDFPYDRYAIDQFATVPRDGGYVARRRLPLSPYQKAHECREEVWAPTMRQLIGLCMAERIKADMIMYVEQEFEAAHGHPPECPEATAGDAHDG